ncbi:MAG: AEC family transporter [Lawsonibacter sp.]|jgi:predicted permease|nr:AEC family transporter [Lawsonibacter sp.]
MSGFFNAVSACLVVLLLMAVGYFMGVKGWMTAAEKNFLSRFIINIAVPANCIVGLLNNLDRAELARAGVQLLSVLLGVGITLLLSMGAASLLRLPRARWGVFAAMAGLSNVLFIGIPVCTQLFGEVCVPYVMLYYLGNTTFLQSAGILLVERSGDRGERSEGPGRFLRDMFTKPPILGVLLAIALLLLDVTPPGPVMRFTGYISSTVSPLALIYGGFIVYEVGLKNLRFLRGLPTMLVIRLAVAPVICWGCCRLFGLDGLVRNVFLVESALPVVSQVTVMAGAYGADEEYAATGACLSIFGCFVTLPILMLVIG